jgi:hypothetical protein
VLGVTALAADLGRAQALANAAAARIRFPGAFFRRDIGHRVLGANSQQGGANGQQGGATGQQGGATSRQGGAAAARG